MVKIIIIIIIRLFIIVNVKLRKNKQGSYQDIDKLFTFKEPKNIVQNGNDNYRVYINFINFEKAFDVVHRESV